MINGACKNYNTGKMFTEGWSTKFVAVPRIGDKVMRIRKMGEWTATREVMRITHFICRESGPELNKPFIIVDLK